MCSLPPGSIHAVDTRRSLNHARVSDSGRDLTAPLRDRKRVRTREGDGGMCWTLLQEPNFAGNLEDFVILTPIGFKLHREVFSRYHTLDQNVPTS